MLAHRRSFSSFFRAAADTAQFQGMNVMLGRNLRVTMELSLLPSLSTFYVSAKCTSVPAEKVLGMRNVQSLEMLQFASGEDISYETQVQLSGERGNGDPA